MYHRISYDRLSHFAVSCGTLKALGFNSLTSSVIGREPVDDYANTKIQRSTNDPTQKKKVTSDIIAFDRFSWDGSSVIRTMQYTLHMVQSSRISHYP